MHLGGGGRGSSTHPGCRDHTTAAGPPKGFQAGLSGTRPCDLLGGLRQPRLRQQPDICLRAGDCAPVSPERGHSGQGPTEGGGGG